MDCRVSKRRDRDEDITDREAIHAELSRILQGLDADPRAAERRYARMSERDQVEIRALLRVFAPLGRPKRIIRYRLEGGRLVREAEVGEEVPSPTNGGVGESSSPVAAVESSPSVAAVATAPGAEDELCSALGSARF